MKDGGNNGFGNGNNGKSVPSGVCKNWMTKGTCADNSCPLNHDDRWRGDLKGKGKGAGIFYAQQPPAAAAPAATAPAAPTYSASLSGPMSGLQYVPYATGFFHEQLPRDPLPDGNTEQIRTVSCRPVPDGNTSNDHSASSSSMQPARFPFQMFFSNRR